MTNAMFWCLKALFALDPDVLFIVCLFFTWMVKVVLAFQSLGLLFWSENSVETVLADNSDLPLMVIHLILTQKLHDFCTDCGLTEKHQLMAWTDNLVRICNGISLNIITGTVTSGHQV